MSMDYETLRLIWWVLQILAIIGFVLCDGLALGVCMSMPLVSKTESERRAVIASIAPTSLGQQGWLIFAVALLFAAWPIAYAVFFSSLQIMLLPILLVLIGRLLGLNFRCAVAYPAWLQNWDKSIGAGGFLATALFGVICGNLLKGMPFHLDSDMRIFFLGNFGELLNPFSLLVSSVCVALLVMYGACFLQLKNTGELAKSCQALIFRSGLGFLILFVTAGLWISHLEGYHVTSEVIPNAVSNPLNKFVKRGEGLWLDNYEHLPMLWSIPVLAGLGTAATLLFARFQREYWSFLASSISVGAAVLTVAVSMFPFLVPSNRSLNSSLTIWDASASLNTLSALLIPAAIALPLMAVISRWSFSLWSGSEVGFMNVVDTHTPFVNAVEHEEEAD